MFGNGEAMEWTMKFIAWQILISFPVFSFSTSKGRAKKLSVYQLYRCMYVCILYEFSDLVSDCHFVVNVFLFLFLFFLLIFLLLSMLSVR